MSANNTFRGSLAAHRDAEQAMFDMDKALARGDYQAAADAAERAADFEREALQTIPVDRWRTRALITESAESLAARALKLRYHCD